MAVEPAGNILTRSVNGRLLEQQRVWVSEASPRRRHNTSPLPSAVSPSHSFQQLSCPCSCHSLLLHRNTHHTNKRLNLYSPDFTIANVVIHEVVATGTFLPSPQCLHGRHVFEWRLPDTQPHDRSSRYRLLSEPCKSPSSLHRLPLLPLLRHHPLIHQLSISYPPIVGYLDPMTSRSSHAAF
jgi:hypothetical protein